MDKKRPQLSLDELHQLKWLLGGGLTLLAVLTVCYMDIEAWTLMGLTAVAAGACTVWPRLPARLPSLVHLLAFPFIVIFFVGDLWLTTEVLPAMVRLDILLLLYRGVSYRQRRDDLQIVVLGLFLIVVADTTTTPANSPPASATMRQSVTSRTRRASRPQSACTAQAGAISLILPLSGRPSSAAPISVIASRNARAHAA